MPSLSTDLRAANQALWDAMQGHRFVRDIEADCLPRSVFTRYLIYEHAFVETAILIFGNALLKAPNLAARRRLCFILDGLAGEQLSYFDRLFAAFDVKPSEIELPLAVKSFCRDMLTMAESGSYFTIITMMLAAEWTYATWCGRANQSPSADEAIAEWVRLHAERPFLDQAEWLRAEIETSALSNDGEGCKMARQAFATTLTLEIDFHSAPYEGARS